MIDDFWPTLETLVTEYFRKWEAAKTFDINEEVSSMFLSVDSVLDDVLILTA